MRVSIKKSEDEIRKELFAPVQEASRLPYQLNVNPRNSWCELSELRLTTLICKFKPAGVNRSFNLMAIADHMSKVYDNEHAQSEIFLSDSDQVRFRNQQRALLMGACPTGRERLAFPPKYMCRPTLELVEKKIAEWFGMKEIEENECYPDSFGELHEFKLPDYICEEMEEEKEDLRDSPVVAPSSHRKRRIPTPED